MTHNRGRHAAARKRVNRKAPGCSKWVNAHIWELGDSYVLCPPRVTAAYM